MDDDTLTREYGKPPDSNRLCELDSQFQIKHDTVHWIGEHVTRVRMPQGVTRLPTSFLCSPLFIVFEDHGLSNDVYLLSIQGPELLTLIFAPIFDF